MGLHVIVHTTVTVMVMAGITIHGARWVMVDTTVDTTVDTMVDLTIVDTTMAFITDIIPEAMTITEIIPDMAEWITGTITDIQAHPLP